MKNLFKGLTETDRNLCIKIARRAKKINPRIVESDTALDLAATHLNGCKLRLEEMVKADDFNLMHDVYGIGRHLNRKTGKLERFFLPRFHKTKTKEAA